MAEQDSGTKQPKKLSQEQRKLAAEAYRRPLSLESEDPLRQLQARQIYSAEELQVWSYAQGRVKRGIAEHTTSLPNVTLHQDLVVAASFSPGHLFAVDKRSGERLWMRRLSTYGAKPVSAGEYLLCGDYRMLLSLEPQTGKQIWKFQPGDDNGEYLFSTSVYANGAVFIGDWLGYLTCLDATTGKIRWSVPAEPGRRSWVNATALPYEDLVITATNSEVALAYDQATGQEVWRRPLPESSAYQVYLYAGMALVRMPTALYGLCPRTGEILKRWIWSNQEIEAVTVADSTLCVALTNEPKRHIAAPPATPVTELLGIRDEKVQWSLPCLPQPSLGLCWNRTTGLLYESLEQGVGIVDVTSGRRLTLIQGLAAKRPRDWAGLPDADADKLYVLHAAGTLWALQHPYML